MANRKIHNMEDLELAIAESEKMVQQKQAALKEQFQLTKDSLNPSNIAKSTFGNIFEQITGNGNLGSLLVKALGGITASVVAHKVSSNKKQGFSLSSIAGNAAKAWGAALLANNADKLMAYGTAIFHNLFSANHKNGTETPNKKEQLPMEPNNN